MGVWPCGRVGVCFGGGMSDAIGSKNTYAIGSKNTCKTISTEFFDWIRQLEFSAEKS